MKPEVYKTSYPDRRSRAQNLIISRPIKGTKELFRFPDVFDPREYIGMEFQERISTARGIRTLTVHVLSVSPPANWAIAALWDRRDSNPQANKGASSSN